MIMSMTICVFIMFYLFFLIFTAAMIRSILRSYQLVSEPVPFLRNCRHHHAFESSPLEVDEDRSYDFHRLVRRERMIYEVLRLRFGCNEYIGIPTGGQCKGMGKLMKRNGIMWLHPERRIVGDIHGMFIGGQFFHLMEISVIGIHDRTNYDDLIHTCIFVSHVYDDDYGIVLIYTGCLTTELVHLRFKGGNFDLIGGKLNFFLLFAISYLNFGLDLSAELIVDNEEDNSSVGDKIILSSAANTTRKFLSRILMVFLFFIAILQRGLKRIADLRLMIEVLLTNCSVSCYLFCILLFVNCLSGLESVSNPFCVFQYLTGDNLLPIMAPAKQSIRLGKGKEVLGEMTEEDPNKLVENLHGALIKMGVVTVSAMSERTLHWLLHIGEFKDYTTLWNVDKAVLEEFDEMPQRGYEAMFSDLCYFSVRGNYDCDVVCFTADVGQGEKELEVVVSLAELLRNTVIRYYVELGKFFETYVFWNGQELFPGKYSFSGRYDLVKFVKSVQEAGMFLMLRIGSFVAAEWNFGHWYEFPINAKAAANGYSIRSFVDGQGFAGECLDHCSGVEDECIVTNGAKVVYKAEGDCMGYRAIAGCDEAKMGCFSYAISNLFWKKNDGNLKQIERVRATNGNSYFSLSDNLLELCLVRFPLTYLMTATLVCKK